MKIDYLKHKFFNKHKNLLLKFVLTIFLFGIAFRLFFFHSAEISPVLEPPFPEKTTVLEPPVSTEVTEDEAKNVDQVSRSPTGERRSLSLLVLCYFAWYLPFLFLDWRRFHWKVQEGKYEN